jgi:putative spermidine/putrescine transport system permease protein
MEVLSSHRRRIWIYVLGAGVLCFLMLPCLLVIPISFSTSQYLEFPPRHWGIRWYASYFSSAEWIEATLMSVKLGLATTAVATPIGLAASYGLRHLQSSLGKSAIQQIFLLPMMVPAILIAVALFLVYAQLGLNNTFTGLLLAHVALALPFVVIAVSSGFENYDMTQELAARSLGATRLQAFMTVTLPQIRAGVLSGGLFAFITSFDEAVVAIFVSGGETETLTKRIFANIRDEIDPTVAAVSSMLMLLSIVVFVAVQICQRRR